MLHEELLAVAEPVVDKVRDHPFWAGLRDGTLPGECLRYFVAQDTGYLLPGYARALARCAAAAPLDAHAALLSRSVIGTLEAKDRLRARYEELAPGLRIPSAAREPVAVGPTTHAYASFFAAASVTSFGAGVGALVPMLWFNFQVSADLAARSVPQGRYSGWIESYLPGDGYEFAVRAMLDMVDTYGEQCSGAERDALVEQFTLATRYEWAFAEASWRQLTWQI